MISHKFIGSASKASGSLMTVTCKLMASINVSCLHFGQNIGKFLSIVSSRILSLVLLLQTGHKSHLFSFIVLDSLKSWDRQHMKASK